MSEYTGPSTRVIRRAKGFRSPAETYTYPADLTGHTAHLVIETSAGVEVTAIAGVIVTGATSTITFAIDALAVATAGDYAFSFVMDRGTASAAELIEVGDWIVTDYAGEPA